MKELAMQLYLFWGAWRDIKTRSIPLWYLMVGGVLSLLFMINESTYDREHIIFCLIPGGLFLIFSLLRQKEMGYGDGILVGMAGIWVPDDIWKICYVSLLLISIFSLLMLLLKKYSLKTKIPYYPFFWLAFIICRGGYYV